MNKKLLATLSMATVIGATAIAAPMDVKTIEAKTIKPVGTFYTGKVEAINKGIFSFTNAGKLKNIAKVGDYVFSPIKDNDGNILRPGTPLAQQDTKSLEIALDAALMQEKIAKMNFLAGLKNFKRAQKLKDKAMSNKDFLAEETSFYTSKLDLDKAKNEVEQAKYDLEVATLMSPYSGMVTGSFMLRGARAGDGDDAVEVTQMTPLLVNIPFENADIIRNVKEATAIKIYPEGSNKPVDAWATTSSKGLSIYAYLHNKVVPTISLTPEQEKLKRVFDVAPVIKTSSSAKVINELGDLQDFYKNMPNNPLTIPTSALHTDSKGSYVFMVDRSSFTKGDTSNDLLEFKVKKEYVTPGKISRNLNFGTSGNVNTTSLEKPGSLTTDDIVVALSQPGIKDGDTVIKETVRWEFMPNTYVKVEVPSLNKQGIYVPETAVITQVPGDNYVYIADNGKAKLVPITITGKSDSYYSVSSKDLKDGDKVIVLDNPEDYKNLYDTAPITVSGSVENTDKLLHPRAQFLQAQQAPISTQIPLDA